MAKTPSVSAVAQYRCVHCGAPSSDLYRRVGQDICLSQCASCGKVVDPYIEFEILLVFIDMQLMRAEVYRHMLFNRFEASTLAREAFRFLLLCFLLDAHACWSTIHGTSSGREPTMFGWLQETAGDWAVLGATCSETATYLLTLSVAALLGSSKPWQISSPASHVRIWEAVSISSFGKIYTLVPTIWGTFSADNTGVDQAIAIALSLFIAISNALAIRTVLEDKDCKRAGTAVAVAYIARALSRRLLLTQA